MAAVRTNLYLRSDGSERESKIGESSKGNQTVQGNEKM